MNHVHAHERALSEEDVPSRERLQGRVDVHEARGVHQRAGVAPELTVITLSLEVPAHLVHVRAPIDLGVRHSPHDQRAQDALRQDERDAHASHGGDVPRIVEAREERVCARGHRDMWHRDRAAGSDGRRC